MKYGSRSRHLLGVAPGLVAGALPACPVCWPVYAALMTSLGLGFLLNTTYLIPVTVASLSVALFGLGRLAYAGRRYGPAVLGVLASGVLLLGKFRLDSDVATYLSVAALACAALWSVRPRRYPTRLNTPCGCEASRPSSIHADERRSSRHERQAIG